MNALFVDTAGWMACADAGDPAHATCAAARDAALERGSRLVTTDFVIDETLTLIKLRLGMTAAREWWNQVQNSQRVQWERVDAGRFDDGLALFFRYKDKGFSFTDCTSFAVMRELKITTALTTDRHFSQMKFVVVPASGRGKRPARR